MKSSPNKSLQATRDGVSSSAIADDVIKDVVFHTLRRTYISRLVSAGADIRTVQELAGHKTIAMTMRYAYLAPAHKRRAVGLLDAEVGAKVTTVDFSRAGKTTEVSPPRHKDAKND
jgi:integrase